MNRYMFPQPADDYPMLCLKLIAAAKLYYRAHRELCESPTDGAATRRDAKAEARALLDACIAAMGEPVEFGAGREEVANG